LGRKRRGERTNLNDHVVQPKILVLVKVSLVEFDGHVGIGVGSVCLRKKGEKEDVSEREEEEERERREGKEERRRKRGYEQGFWR